MRTHGLTAAMAMLMTLFAGCEHDDGSSEPDAEQPAEAAAKTRSAVRAAEKRDAGDDGSDRTPPAAHAYDALVDSAWHGHLDLTIDGTNYTLIVPSLYIFPAADGTPAIDSYVRVYLSTPRTYLRAHEFIALYPVEWFEAERSFRPRHNPGEWELHFIDHATAVWRLPGVIGSPSIPLERGTEPAPPEPLPP